MNNKNSAFAIFFLLLTFTTLSLWNAKVSSRVVYLHDDEMGNHESDFKHKREHLCNKTTALDITIAKVEMEKKLSVEGGSDINNKDVVEQRNLHNCRRHYIGR